MKLTWEPIPTTDENKAQGWSGVGADGETVLFTVTMNYRTVPSFYEVTPYLPGILGTHVDYADDAKRYAEREYANWITRVIGDTK